MKATESNEPPSLSIGDLGNEAVAERVKAIRKKLLNPLRALQAMKPQKTVSNGGSTVNNNAYS